MTSAPFLYENNQFQSKTKAIIVLPEIFGITEGIVEITDKFATEFELPAFALDFFYQLTGEPTRFVYEVDAPKGVDLMNKMTSQDFEIIFNKSLEYISQTHPNIVEFIVVGFCFGGRLAYLAGTNPNVTKVISFYGGNANLPFVAGHSVVEALSQSKSGNENFEILALFGTEDRSIPIEDIEIIRQTLQENSVNYSDVIIADARHAFFNHRRKNYNPEAAEMAWELVKNFLK